MRRQNSAWVRVEVRGLRVIGQPTEKRQECPKRPRTGEFHPPGGDGAEQPVDEGKGDVVRKEVADDVRKGRECVASRTDADSLRHAAVRRPTEKYTSTLSRFQVTGTRVFKPAFPATP